MASRSITLGEIRRRVLQRLGCGGLTDDGREDPRNRPIPLDAFDYEINTALQTVMETVTAVSPFKGIRRITTTFAANVQEMSLASLGVTNSRIESVYLLNQQGFIYARVRNIVDDSAVISQNAAFGGIGITSYPQNLWFGPTTAYAWSLSPPDMFRLAPAPAAPLPMQIRVYASDGFENLIDDFETVPADYFFHRCVEDMLIYTVMERIDPNLQRRAGWGNKIVQIKAENSQVFMPQRPLEMVFMGV